MATIEPERIQTLNDRPIQAGRYVLCWVQASHRAEGDAALDERGDGLTKGAGPAPAIWLYVLQTTSPRSAQRGSRGSKEVRALCSVSGGEPDCAFADYAPGPRKEEDRLDPEASSQAPSRERRR